jgi:tripartite-type tricarboxylate transporter receptor subunit TctC
MRRRALLAGLGLGALALGPAAAVAAPAWPERPVRLVVPYPAGGPVDFIARVIQPRLQELWGQPVIVDNIGGGSGMIGSATVARARPDGYTLLLAGIQTHAMNAAVMRRMPYDPLKDFTPVAQLTRVNWMLVANPSAGIKTPAQLVAAIRAKPGGYTYASSGNGSAAHLTFAMLLGELGLNTVHVPYKGSAQAIQDVIAGQVQFGMADRQLLAPYIGAGKLVPIAMTGSARAATLPQVPTLAETIAPGFDMQPWQGIYGPAGMDPALAQRIAAGFAKALTDPAVSARLGTAGIDVAVSAPAEFLAFTRAEHERWIRVAHDAHVTPE